MKIVPVKKQFRIIGLAACAVTLWVVLSTTGCAKPEPIKIVPPAATALPAPTQTPQPMQVYVSGMVIAPDVYVLEPGSRIKQLVEAAGGFADGADTAVVNLAQPLTDGAHVHIPALGEESVVSPPVISSPAPARSSEEIPIGSGGNLININLALQDELETLPGIGPITAQKILDYRAANGSFTNIEGIMSVSGIGEGKFERIRSLITVGN